MIYIGIDDTDTADTAGTNQLARALVARLGVGPRDGMIMRHQLLFDPRVPYTSKNGSASVRLQSAERGPLPDLIEKLRQGMQSWFVKGSDPGLCVAARVPDEVVQFGRRCQRELVGQQEARDLAARHGIHLEGLGGTEDGVIGALAAVGLAATDEDGRVVHLASWPWPDDLTGPQEVATLRARGIDEIRCVGSDELVTDGVVDIGKRLRPNRRGGRVVLYVTPTPESWPASSFWQAVRRN